MVPVRTCVGCRRRRPCEELLRITAGPRGLEPSRHGPGRGAWLCRDALDCFDRAVRRKAFDRALRTRVGTEELAKLGGLLAALRRPGGLEPGSEEPSP
ncbi:MAG: YlxR family protein [Acidimicrobiales bacterium]